MDMLFIVHHCFSCTLGQSTLSCHGKNIFANSCTQFGALSKCEALEMACVTRQVILTAFSFFLMLY